MEEERPKGLQTVDRALQVLQCFTPDRPSMALTDVARELGIAKSMASRLLETLELHGFVERNPENKRYTLGLTMVRLGVLAQTTSGDLLPLALPIMQELTTAAGETTLLCVPRRIHSVCLEQVTTKEKGLRLAIERGTISPLYAGASNKALLAFLPESQIDEVIASGLTAFTDQTLADPVRLRAALAEIRKRGWDASGGELTLDVAAVAAPVFDPYGRVVASLSVGGPTYRFTADRIPVLVGQVQEAAQRLTRRLAGG